VVDECRRDNLVAIVPPGHPKADLDTITMEALLEYPFICREEGSGTREVIADYMTQCHTSMEVAMELGSPEAVKGAVEAGMGISVVSNATIQKELRLGTLVAIDLEPPLERPFSFVHQKQKFRVRVMEELLEFARAYCEEHRDQ
jgi:DNA-binding transcriptional LysR family regulator